MPCLSRIELMVDGFKKSFRCQKCYNCRSDRVRDWTGRLLAEAKYSVGAHCITLTYGGVVNVQGLSDNPNALLLTYPDVQKWLKRLRNNGFPMRYLISGEYGSAKQRAHWHCLLFWKEQAPPLPEHVADKHGNRRCWDDPYWPSGHTQWGEVNPAAIRYVCKYLVSDDKDPAHQSMVRMSKKPLLGARFFDDLARQLVQQGLAPRDRIYRIDGSIDATTGKLWRYWMNDPTVDYLVNSFLSQWRQAHGDVQPPYSELVERYLDKRARPEIVIERRPYVRRFKPHINPDGSLVTDENPATFHFEEGRNVWVGEDPSGARVFYTYDADGAPGWNKQLVSPSQAGRMRRNATSAAYVEASSPSSTKNRTRG